MEVKDSPMATGHDENESFDQRFGRLLDALLSNPPEETTTREQLAAFRDKLVGCLQEGRSRRLIYAQFIDAGGVVSYQRFCVLLNDLVADQDRVSAIKRKYGKGSRGREEQGSGSKLIEARRSGRGIGKSLEQIQRETTEALVGVAGFGKEN
jgi:hypothetical protein